MLKFSFVKNNQKILNGPVCYISERADGSMRFRWNEENHGRKAFFEQVCGCEIDEKSSASCVKPLELIHSRFVVDLKNGDENLNVQSDGLITKNPDFIPVVTVADCMPLYLYDSVTGVFGVVHSGWKGTGIIAEAIKLAEQNYGAKAEDFSVVIGPHIRSCCYIVNEERAEYFASNFTPECVTELEKDGKCYAGGRGLSVSWNNGSGKLYRLSLEKANLAVLKKAGVKTENISVTKECTCCNEKLGSNRRETADFLVKNPDASKNELSRCFTVQAAFVKWM